MFILIDNFGFHAQLEHHVKMGIEVARKKKSGSLAARAAFCTTNAMASGKEK